MFPAGRSAKYDVAFGGAASEDLEPQDAGIESQGRFHITDIQDGVGDAFRMEDCIVDAAQIRVFVVVSGFDWGEAGWVAGCPGSFPVTDSASVPADFPPLLRGIGVYFDAVAIGVTGIEAAGDVVVRDAKTCTGVSGSAVTFDQVGLALKLEGQVIQGGGGGVPEDGDIVVGVAVAEKPPTAGPCRSVGAALR